MSAIGYVTYKENGSYEGFLRTLTIDAPIKLVVSGVSITPWRYNSMAIVGRFGSAYGH